jgi:translation initiation factor 2 beta subunit (eIF-2beta)/eIF-5
MSDFSFAMGNKSSYQEINIDGSDDFFYRYKMPAVETIYVNKKGGFTKWVNIKPICKAIYRNPSNLKSYYSKKLGIKCTINSNDEMEFKTIIDSAKIQKLLFDYINRNVLCKNCKSPETIKMKCRSCGMKTGN